MFAFIGLFAGGILIEQSRAAYVRDASGNEMRAILVAQEYMLSASGGVVISGTPTVRASGTIAAVPSGTQNVAGTVALSGTSPISGTVAISGTSAVSGTLAVSNTVSALSAGWTGTCVTSSTVMSGSSVPILSANSARRYACITNTTGATMYLSLGGTAATGAGIVLQNGQTYEVNSANLFVGQVTGLATSGTVAIQEN